MENIIAILRVDYYFCFQTRVLVDCLDLYTNLIIFLNGEVISLLASLNGNYDGRERGKRLFKCTLERVLFAHTNRYMHIYERESSHCGGQKQMFVLNV